MSAIRIRKMVQFSAVPDAVFSLGMGHTAVLILAWALGRPDGWEFHIGHMMRVLNLTDKTWPRAKKELVKAGFFVQIRSRGERGKIEWFNEFTDEPLWTSNPAIPPSGRDGEGMDAKGGDLVEEVNKVSKAVVVQKAVSATTTSIQKKNSKSQARGAPGNAPRKLDNPKDLDVLMRPFMKNELDQERWEGLKAEFSDEQLRAAIVEIINAGSQPFTSYISKTLRPQQRKATKEPSISSSHRTAILPSTTKSSPDVAVAALAAAKSLLSAPRA